MSHARQVSASPSTSFRTRAGRKLGAGIRVLLAVALITGGGVAFTAPAFADGPTVPMAPLLTLVSTSDASAVLHVESRVADASNPISGYTVTANSGQIELDNLPAGDVTVTGLTADTAYTFTAIAWNAAGTSAASSPLAVQALTVAIPIPGPPTNLQLTLGGGPELDIAWDPPEQGADLATGYELIVSEYGSIAWSYPVDGTSFSFNGLPGITYTISVRCLYGDGGTQQSQAVTGVAATIPPDHTPSSPTLSSRSIGRTSTVLTIAVPQSDGGLPITGYTLSGRAGYLAPSWNFPATIELDNLAAGDVSVTGLLPETVYTFNVTAHNQYYTSAASSPLTFMTGPLVTSPDAAPTRLAMYVLAGPLHVSWTPPAAGLTYLEGYEVTAQADGHPTITTVVPGTSVELDGLLPGITYTISVQCIYSDVDQLSNPLTGIAPVIPIPPTVPDAPGLALAADGSGQVQLKITAPVNDGGSAITGYTIIDAQHGISQSAAAGVSTISGLTNGVAYTFTAVASNSQGPSATSGTVTIVPVNVPDAARLRIVPKWYTLQAVITAPANTGGSPVTGYTATLTRAGMATKTVTVTTAGTVTFTGLTPKTGYLLRVVARNAVGTSPAASATVTTAGLPAPVPIPRTPTAMTAGESQILSGAGLFATGSATPSAAALRELMVLAHELAGAKAIQCAGYTDLDGGPLANYLVGLARAQTVCWVLRVDGVRATVSTISYGQSRPVTIGANRELNRRVVVTDVR